VRPAPEPAGDGVVTYAISPRRGLLLFPADRAAAVRERLAGASFVLDVTAQHGILALVGPEAPTVLRRLTHLHRFPSGGSVAHVTAHVLERGGGYWIVFPQEYGHYLYEVAVDRASALGGGPVGTDALGAIA
jgi:glycine cleavage system aminomethyltransferase T